MTLATASSTNQENPLDSLNNGFDRQLINLPYLYQVIDYFPLTISPDSWVMEGINLINQQKVNNLIHKANDYILVVKAKQLLGIFTIKDILRVITLNINLSAVKMADVMTQPLITLKYSASEHILTVFALLQQHCIQHLPIVDDEDNLMGIVTEANLLQALNIEKMIGVVKTLQEDLLDPNTEHTAINQQLEVIRKQTHDDLQRWARIPIDENIKINRELQETLEELQIAEEELRQQNEQLIFSREITEAERQRYQNLFEFAPNGYLVTNTLGVIQQANHGVESLLSVRQDHLIGKPLVVFIAKEYRSQFVSRLQKLHNLQEWEMNFQSRKGLLFPAIVRVNPIFDSQGKQTGCLWSISDISDSKKLEAALRQDSDILENRVKERTAELVIANERLQQEIIEREQIQASLQESEARLTLALESGNIGIWDWHIQTNETLWSPTMGLMYGLPLNTSCPSSEDFLNLIYPEDRQHFQSCVTHSIVKKVDFFCEHRRVDCDGVLHWLSCTGKVYYDENDQPIRMIGTTRDISERKQTEEQIYEQAALLDIATDAIFVRDFQAQIVFWNQGAERIYGWQRQEVEGKNPKDIFYDSTSHEQEIIALKTVVKSGNWEGELRKRTKSNRLIIVQSRWTLMLEADGKPKSILTVDTDITENKQREEQSFRAQRMESIGTLAGGIAHDINNILTPILASAQLLKSRLSAEKDKDRRQQMLTIIENNAKQGAALVKQLLSFAKGVEGKQTIVQINNLINDIIQFASQTSSRSITFSTHLYPKLGTISADKTQLYQVLMNLVVNAADAMPNGGYLSVSTENLYLNEEMMHINHDAKVGNYTVITVRDTGMGMSPEILERIFEPFFTTKDFGKGTGLGLSTVLGIIKSHKGFINVESQVGLGSVFQIFLPSVNQEVAVLESDHQEICQGQRELILLVDDEAEIREVTITVLEAYNYQVITAKNGIEAIAIYSQYQDQIRVVLMDIMMPGMNGNSAIYKLKEINPHVPIIACSGCNIENMIESRNEVNVAAILSKPYTNEELLEKLNFVLK